jgi:hypothetical protein
VVEVEQFVHLEDRGGWVEGIEFVVEMQVRQSMADCGGYVDRW